MQPVVRFGKKLTNLSTKAISAQLRGLMKVVDRDDVAKPVVKKAAAEGPAGS